MTIFVSHRSSFDFTVKTGKLFLELANGSREGSNGFTASSKDEASNYGFVLRESLFGLLQRHSDKCDHKIEALKTVLRNIEARPMTFLCS